MKKIAKVLVLVIALTMVLSLTACGGEKDPIVGTWTAVQGFSDGKLVDYNNDDNHTWFKMNKDGTGEGLVAGGEHTITWSYQKEEDGDRYYTLVIDGDQTTAGSVVMNRESSFYDCFLFRVTDDLMMIYERTK